MIGDNRKSNFSGFVLESNDIGEIDQLDSELYYRCIYICREKSFFSNFLSRFGPYSCSKDGQEEEREGETRGLFRWLASKLNGAACNSHRL